MVAVPWRLNHFPAANVLYWTVNEAVADSVSVVVPNPDVAVMITVYVPVGVPGLVDCVGLDPPHPENATHHAATTKRRPE
jgi:hypothetical protein